MDEVTLTSGHDYAWDQLVAAVNNRKHGLRTFTLATIDKQGFPQARTMVLRGADRTEHSLQFNTDVRASKVAELRDSPTASAVFYHPGDKLQIRAQGVVTLHCQDIVAAEAWQKMQRMSRDCYRTPYAPSSVRTNREGDTDSSPLTDPFANFVVCNLTVFALDWLLLSSTGHMRARHDYGNKGIITSQWLHP